MEFRPFDSLIAIDMLLDFWIHDNSLAMEWSHVTRKTAEVLSYRSRRQKSCQLMWQEWDAIKPQRGCHTIATRACKPCTLAEVLEAIKHFQCADSRDRLYGVLCLVDWYGDVPTPDYGKTRFQVAVEVLQIYLEQALHSPHSLEILAWPEQLFHVFGVAWQDEALQKAIKVRYPRSAIPPALVYNFKPFETDTREPEVPECTPRWDLGGNLIRFAQFLASREIAFMGNSWFGVRLHRAKSLEKGLFNERADYLYYNAPAAEQRVGRVYLSYGVLFAYVPSCTQVGDWLLSNVAGYLKSPSTLSIIIRPPENNQGGKYTIIGQAHIFNGASKMIPTNNGFEYFQIRWNAEDLFLFTWSYVIRPSLPEEEDELADYLNVRICGSEGSSDATKLDKSQYVDMSKRTSAIPTSTEQGDTD
jgi:hypothetical protein